MRLQAAAFTLFLAIASASCNNNNVLEELSDPHKSADDVLKSSHRNNKDEIAFNKSETHNLRHNNNLLESVVITNNSSNFESLIATSESGDNISESKRSDFNKLAKKSTPPSADRKLPRHQRAIAAVAEQRGLLKDAGGERVLRRGKRYLQFAKGSRVSWRTAGKNNILNINTLWAYGYGFRVNFPFPGPDESRRPFFKRDVLHSLEDVLNGHGLDGRACVLKSYCTAALDVDSSISGGMLFKMLKLIFTLHDHDKRHFSYLRLENCKQILHSHCPLSFDSISPYTDDV